MLQITGDDTNLEDARNDPSRSKNGPPGIEARYVDNDDPNAADDEQHGSITMPWATLAYAFNQLVPGQTLYIRAGTYENSGIDLREGNSGRNGEPITVKPFPDEEVVLRDGGEIRFYGADWWVLEGLRFDRFPSIKLGLHVNLGHSRTSATENIVIRNSEFSNGDRSAITINFGNEILIEGNHFHHIRPGVPFTELGRETNAINLRYMADNIQILDNRFEDIGSDGVHIGSESTLPGADIGSVEIKRNEFWINRPYVGILGNVGENGIDVKKSRGPIVISQNRIHGFRPTTPEQDASGANGDGLIVHGEAQNVTIERNLIYSNTAQINIAQGAGAGPSNIIIQNNILMDSVSSDLSGSHIEGSGLQVRSAVDVFIYHNTLVNNEYYLRSAFVSRGELKNNVIIGGKDSLQNGTLEWSADYNAWSQLTHPRPEILRGPHDLSGEDLGLDQDLRPTVDSPLVNSGFDVGVTEDFDGLNRYPPPDIGAQEYDTGPLLHEVWMPSVVN